MDVHNEAINGFHGELNMLLSVGLRVQSHFSPSHAPLKLPDAIVVVTQFSDWISRHYWPLMYPLLINSSDRVCNSWVVCYLNDVSGVQQTSGILMQD